MFHCVIAIRIYHEGKDMAWQLLEESISLYQYKLLPQIQ